MQRLIKIILLIIGFYLLGVLQTSFFVHLQILNRIPAVLLITIILWNFFERDYAVTGLWTALLAGFLTDVFSSRPFGFTSAIFLLSALFIKLVVKRYVRIPIIESA